MSHRKMLGFVFLLGFLPNAWSQVAPDNPVFVQKERIRPGFNLIGISVVGEPVKTGLLSESDGVRSTDESSDFSELLIDREGVYTIEIERGYWSAIKDVDGDTLISEYEIVGCEKEPYVIRKMMTVEELFGSVDATLLNVGTDAEESDIIWIPDGNGFAKLYPTKGDGFFLSKGWRRISTADTDQGSFPIPFTSGIFIERRGETEVDLSFEGHLKTTQTLVFPDKPYNYVSRSYPNLKLNDLGILRIEANGSVPWSFSDADILWMPGKSGDYIKSWYSFGDGFFTTEGWSKVGAQPGSIFEFQQISITSGFIFEKRFPETLCVLIMTPPGAHRSTWKCIDGNVQN